MAQAQFREDLFFRLNVVPLVMPPLRERKEDIPSLVKHFSKTAATNHGVDEPKFTKDVMALLMDNYWPGNVRELGNIVERIVLLADDTVVSADDVPILKTPATNNQGQFQLPIDGFSWQAHERDCLNQALTLANGNRAEAARILDLPYKTFLYRLEKHGI